MEMDTPSDRSAIFEQYRARLFGIAYRMTGSQEDAEDLVQETYLRWHQTDAAAVRTPEAWLVAVVTRLSVDRLRRLASERAAYEGTWLPEPLRTAESSTPAHEAELASDLSIAFLVLLERLAPEERAALLLHEVFDWSYGEIARTLGRSAAACRQIVHRARERVRRDRPRFPVPPEAKEHLLERFLAALAADDEAALLSLLASDVTFAADGGGRVPSVRRVVRGADRVARLLLGYERKARGIITQRIEWLNGEPAIVAYVADRVVFTMAVETDGERVHACYRVLNPAKLRRLGDLHGG
jgi:RNA polymerase sigma-70 factor (ECF subfamily)